MRKILFMLAAAALLLGISSCGKLLDRNDNYVIAFEIQGHITDQADSLALATYFDTNFLTKDDYVTYSGSYSDAVTKAADFFEERRKEVDGMFILSHINDPQDILYLLCVMSGTKTREIVSSVYWDYNLKEELGLVTEE